MASGEMYQGYHYDEPLGLWSHLSNDMIGRMLISNFHRYEDGLQKLGIADTYGTIRDLEPLGELGLSALVVEGERSAHALAAMPSNDANRLGFEAFYYGIDLEGEPSVSSESSMFVTHSRYMKHRADYEMELAELKRHFSKEKLEAVMRMIGKTAANIEMLSHVSDGLPKLTSRSQDLSNTFDRRLQLSKKTVTEPRVVYALQEYALGDLTSLFPGKREPAEAPVMEPLATQEIIHIMEWPELLKAAGDWFRRASDVTQPQTTVALQHEIDTNHYLIKLQARHGELSKIKLLCYDETGTSHKKKFDLQTQGDEDDLDRLRISPFWNQAELLECFREGRPISEEMYQSYLQHGESREVSAQQPEDNVTDIDARKRPAA